jgi:hypothetical protein
MGRVLGDVHGAISRGTAYIPDERAAALCGCVQFGVVVKKFMQSADDMQSSVQSLYGLYTPGVGQSPANGGYTDEQAIWPIGEGFGYVSNDGDACPNAVAEHVCGVLSRFGAVDYHHHLILAVADNPDGGFRALPVEPTLSQYRNSPHDAYAS